GEQIDNLKFFSGGSYSAAFVDASGMNFWPRPGSLLIGAANASLVASLDFNGTSRTSPYDIGAYETEGLGVNPGWQIAPGFKVTGSQPMLPPLAPTNLQVQ
ncbi:MAG TPA: choice-of-anchor Q domain-containing protein, partial [Nitrososphaera sp.]|nr:choice-of-anchor Q domain-containing protein [Nitrososphaera sp.]